MTTDRFEPLQDKSRITIYLIIKCTFRGNYQCADFVVFFFYRPESKPKSLGSCFIVTWLKLV